MYVGDFHENSLTDSFTHHTKSNWNLFLKIRNKLAVLCQLIPYVSH
jgi:hypothetical protein